MYSNNGTTWTTSGSTSVTDGSVWTSVTYGTATGFVAVSNTSVMYSADGITWTNNSINTSLSCVTYGSGLYVAVGNNANVATPSGYVLTNGTISCYVKGCKINTMKGFIPIEELVKDDLLIINNTNNYLPISHIGCKKITVSNLDEPLNCIYKINDNMVTGGHYMLVSKEYYEQFKNTDKFPEYYEYADMNPIADNYCLLACNHPNAILQPCGEYEVWHLTVEGVDKRYPIELENGIISETTTIENFHMHFM